MSVVTWVHDEMLSPAWLLPGRPAVFVFDEGWIREERLSLKRIVFMYECALELPGVEVRRGDVVDEVRVFARQHGAEMIETAASPLPRLRRQGAALGVRWLDPPVFAEPRGPLDLKRFSRYWRRVERSAMSPSPAWERRDA